MISIVVPVYNVAPYLPQCLDSLVNQTYRDIEIICVNDGSTDESAKILDEYAIRDNRVHVIHQQNRGLSGARNTALEKVQGEWIMFVDSDDWIDVTCCQKVLDCANKNNVDVVLWGYRKSYKDYSVDKKLFETDRFFFESEIKILRQQMIAPIGEDLKNIERMDGLGTLWGKLYKRELMAAKRLVDINEIGSAEDVLFNIDVFGWVQSAYYINECLYNYRKEDQSYTKRYRPMLVQQWGCLFDRVNQIIARENLSENFTEALNNRVLLSIIGVGLNECSSDNRMCKKVLAIRSYLFSERYKDAIRHFSMQYLPFHWKLFFYSCKLGWASLVFFLLLVISGIIKK